MQRLWKCAATLVVLVSSAALMGQATQPKIMRVESGAVAVPFHATLPLQASDVLLRALRDLPNYKLDSKWVETALCEQLATHRAAIQAKDGEYFAHLDSHVAELTEAAQKAVKNQMDAKFTAHFSQTVAALCADLEKDQPSLMICGTFRYEEGHRDHGVPGWTDERTVEARGRNWRRGGVVTLEGPVRVETCGVALSLPVRVQLSYSLTTEYAASGLNIFDLNMPVSPVGADPRIRIKAALDVASDNHSIGGNGSIMSGNLSGNWGFSRVAGTLKADPKTKG